MAKFMRIGLFTLAFAGLFFAASRTAPARSSGLRTIRAVQAEEPPRLDGKLEDTCWKQAHEITGFLQYGKTEPAKWQSIGYVCYDKTHLYIGIKCLMPKGIKPTGQMRLHDSSDVFKDDVVEIMIDPGRTGSDYYQLAINAYGATFDCSRHQTGAAEDDAWNGQWEGKSHIGDGYWSTEIAVPYANLGIMPGMGSTWGLNLCRTLFKPRELSSIAASGAWNEAREFAILEDIKVGFGSYFFKIGPGYTVLEPSLVQPTAIFNMPITNMTEKAQQVKIHVQGIGTDGKEVVSSEVYTLSKGQTVVLNLEPLEIESPVEGRGNVRAVLGKPKTQKIIVADAQTGATISLTSVKKPVICEVMRLEVDDPLEKNIGPAKSGEISLRVYTFLTGEALEKGSLILTVATPETGEVLITRTFPSPSRMTEVTIPACGIDWGAYKVRAVFKDSEGRELVCGKAVASVLPGEPYQVKVLNNFVSELMNAKERGLLGEKTIEVMNPREGWCFFSLSGQASILLDDEEKPLAILKAGEKPAEAMRYLSAGRHRLRVFGKSDTSVLSFIVRAIPELQYASLDDAQPLFKEYGKYDWDYLDRIGMLSNLNVFVTRLLRPETPDEVLDRWTSQGKRIIQNIAVPGSHSGMRADESYEYWAKQRGMVHPKVNGLIGNEFIGYKRIVPLFPHYVAAIERLLDEKKDHLFYLYLSAYGGPEAMIRLVRPLVEQDRCRFALERYFHEMPSEERARGYLKSVLSDSFQAFNKSAPGIGKKMIWVTGMLCAPPESVNVNPLVNFKVFTEMQYQLMATDPAAFGVIGGMQIYYSKYADEEYLRWNAKLFRHYCIEGKTDRLSKDPYRLEHIRNPDFEQGLEGWSVTAAEPGSVSVKRMENYGSIQGRYPAPRGLGDTFLWMKRSAEQPNTVSQEIRNLQPGRAYSVKMYVAEYPDLTPRQEKYTVSVTIDGGDMIPEESLHGSFRSIHHPKYPKEKRYMDLFRLVFRAEATTARLTISDWASKIEPGGPVGQELMYNFIEVEPYLMENE